MILRFVDYFNDFKCIAGDCKDTCCVGWELDIDEESFERYKRVEGKFGERLRSFMVEGSDETEECNTFRLVGNRCPFLNEKNLCDIYTELGEKALCKVCSEYPRFKLDFENIRERGLSLSCEVVGDLVFRRKDKVCILEKKVDEESSTEDGETFFTKEIEEVRNKVLDILRDREKTIFDRMLSTIFYVARAQEMLNLEEIEVENLEETVTYEDEIFEDFDFASFYDEILYILEGMEVLDEEWEKAFYAIKEGFSKEKSEVLSRGLEVEKSELWLEQLMVYFVFRYFMKAVYDADLFSKLVFILFGFFVIRMMMAVSFHEKGRLEVEDMIDIVRIYSKEVEHSEENIAYLMEEILFSDSLDENSLLKGVFDVSNKKA